jgi:hypothetical protein
MRPRTLTQTPTVRSAPLCVLSTPIYISWGLPMMASMSCVQAFCDWSIVRCYMIVCTHWERQDHHGAYSGDVKYLDINYGSLSYYSYSCAEESIGTRSCYVRSASGYLTWLFAEVCTLDVKSITYVYLIHSLVAYLPNQSKLSRDNRPQHSQISLEASWVDLQCFKLFVQVPFFNQV